MDGVTYSTYEVRVRAFRAVLNGLPVSDVAKAVAVHAVSFHFFAKSVREVA